AEREPEERARDRLDQSPLLSIHVPSPSVYAIHSEPPRSAVIARSANVRPSATEHSSLKTPAASTSPSSSTFLPLGSAPAGRVRRTRTGHCPCVAAITGRSSAAG